MAPSNILIVDDRGENRYALEQLLEHPERKIYSVSSGEDALRVALEREFALILLDVEMPVMDGYETAQLLRGTKRTRLVPIIFVTAGDRTVERTFRGYESGAIDYLFKPIDPHVLRSKVELFVQLHRRTNELERTSAELRQRIADLEYVHQTLSHDLRAPLRHIRAFSQIALESATQLDPAAADALARVARATDRLRTMIDDLYSLLRLSADASESVPTELGTLLEQEVLEALRGEIESSGAVIKHDPLPKVVANRRLVAQTLQNLIANAIRFRGVDTPVVTVGAQRATDAWQISVSDNGVGIETSERENVFRLFTRLDAQRSGSGVGLALCSRAVEKLGGKIWVESSPPRGSTFLFTIPDRPPA